MYLTLTQPGEALSTKPSIPWELAAVEAAAGQLAELYGVMPDCGVQGLRVIVGSGNTPGRSQVLEAPLATPLGQVTEALGRLGALQNAVVLAAGLAELKVPHVVQTAPEMAFCDPSLPNVRAYGLNKEREAHDNGKIVLIADGSGAAGQTAAAWAVRCALNAAAHVPEAEQLVLQANAYDGIFTADPKRFPGARRYRRLSAGHVRRHATYFRHLPIGHAALADLATATEHVTVQVYASAKHTPAQVVQAGMGIGTLIVPGEGQPQFESFFM